MTKQSKLGEMAEALCREFPSAATKALARMLMKRGGNLVHGYEHARRIIRSYRGESGGLGRKYMRGRIVPTTKFACPASDAKPIIPFVWGIQGKGLLAADLHVPYHDSAAVEMAVNHAIANDATDFVILLGDIQDHYQLSRFVKDARLRDLAGEVEMVKGLLAEFARVFGKVVYKAGNHERRYIDYLRLKAPELLGLDVLDLDNLLGLTAAGIEWLDWNRVIHVGEHLTLMHGHEFGHSIIGPVNAARGLFLRAKACSVCAHYHATSQHDEPNVRGAALSTWSVGCLCDLHPEYAPLNKWNHGFAILSTDGDDWEIENKRIVKGRVR